MDKKNDDYEQEEEEDDDVDDHDYCGDFDNDEMIVRVKEHMLRQYVQN